MSHRHPSTPILLAAVLLLAACRATEPVSYVGHDDSARTTSGTMGTASGAVRPPDWEVRPQYTEEPADPTETFHPDLPQDAIASLRRWMTEEELFDLLGEPDSRSVQVVGVDTDERDWNATVYVWKYQDSRLTTHELTRDLEVRLAQLEHHRPLPARPELRGPGLVVISWELF